MKSVPIGTAVNLALELLIQAQRISTIVAAAQADNRQTLKPEEIQAIKDGRTAAFAKLDDAIDTAVQEGR